MRRILLVLFLVALSSQKTDPFDDIKKLITLERIIDALDVSISKPVEITSISQDEFKKNIFLRADVKPSLISTIWTLASFLLPIKVHDLKLPNLHIDQKDLGLNVTLSNVVLKTIELSDTFTAGIIPVNETTADYVFPTITADFSFDYYIKFGHDRPESGSATLNIEELKMQFNFETYQELEDEKPTGPVKVTLHSNSFDFTNMVGNFSDIYTQTEWDILLENPGVFKKVSALIINEIIKSIFKGVDLRKLLNITFLNTNVIIGLTEPVDYPSIDLPEPDNRSVTVKFHSIVTLPKGDIIEGLFPVDMSQEPLSDQYTSFILTTDVLNRLLRAVTTPKSQSFSFNQALLDFIKFNLLKLDTTSIKPFFPTLESRFGKNLGIYINLYLPNYDSDQCYVRTNAGFGNIVLSVVMEVYVCTDPDTYSGNSLDECLAAGKCFLGVSNLLELLLTLPLQFTTDKKMAPGFVDVELTRVQMTPGTEADGNDLKEKLNNFIDLIIPYVLPEIDISTILAPFIVSLDSLDDQRVALAIALDQ